MDKRIFFLFLFCAAIGLTTGCFFEIYLSGSGKEQLMTLLAGFFGSGSGLSLWTSFWQNFSGSALFLLLSFFLPLVPFLLPFAVLFLFFRGLFLGFSAAMVLETFGINGCLYIALTLAPSGLLQILLFAFLLTCSLQKLMEIQAARKRHPRRKTDSRKALQSLAGPYLYNYVTGLGVLISICLLQAFLLQAVT